MDLVRAIAVLAIAGTLLLRLLDALRDRRGHQPVAGGVTPAPVADGGPPCGACPPEIPATAWDGAAEKRSDVGRERRLVLAELAAVGIVVALVLVRALLLS